MSIVFQPLLRMLVEMLPFITGFVQDLKTWKMRKILDFSLKPGKAWNIQGYVCQFLKVRRK